MIVTRISRPSRAVRCLRPVLLLTTALTLCSAGQAFGQSVTNTGGTTDVTVDVPSASGAPTAVDIQTDGGKIDVTVDAVTANSTGTPGGPVINLLTTGDKSITGAFDTVTVTGDANVYALNAVSDAGDITIDVGTIDAEGEFTRGVYAESQTGDIVLTGDSVRTHGLALDDDGNSGDGMVAVSQQGNASVTLTSGESNSLYGSAVVALGGQNATVVSGNAKTTGDQGVAVYAIANSGTASATTGTVETSGASATAIIASSTNGNAVINAGTTTSTGGRVGAGARDGAGINGAGKTGVSITAGTTTATGVAIVGTSSAGDVTITTTGDTRSTNSSAVTISTLNNTTAARNGTINLGAGTTTSSTSPGNSTVYVANVTNDATVNSLGTVTGTGPATVINVTAGNKALVNANVTTNTNPTTGGAIFATSVNGTTVNAGTTSSAGTAINASSTLGDVAVATTGNTTSLTGNAITANTNIGSGPAGSGNITVSTAAGTTTSTNATNASTIAMIARSDVTLNALGTVTGAQTATATIGGNANGTGKAVLNINEVRNTGTGQAIAFSGANGMEINATTVYAANSSTNALQAGSTTSGNTVVNVGAVTGSAAQNMINVQSINGSTTVHADNVLNSNSSTNAWGINAVGRQGVTIVAGNVEAEGVAIRAATNQGTAIPLNDSHVSITTTGDVTSRSLNAISISGNVASFDITTAAGHTITGNSSSVIAAGTRTGDATIVNNGTIIATGAAEGGIGVTTFGDLTVTSNIVIVNSDVAPTSGFVAGGLGLASRGGGDIRLVSNSVAVTGPNRHGISAVTNGDGIIDVTSNEVSSNSDDNATINAVAEAGSITIDSGTATHSGDHGVAIQATSQGNITIAATTTTSGTRAIDAYSSDGDVSITTRGNTLSRLDGPAIGADGVNVTIVTGQGSVTDGWEGGIDAEARGDLVVENHGTILGHDGDASGILAEVTGTARITSDVITIDGTGEDPGMTGDFRSGQGGIAVTGGDGAIAIDSHSVTVAGDNRYGIYVLGNGAIDVASDLLSYEADDSAGIMIIGGEGEVTVDSGTLTATGTSGAGIVARTTTGAITIHADQTRANGTGQAGDNTADAVVGLSDSGAVVINSTNASTAGRFGSAIVAVGGSATINSTTASSTGSDGAIVYARAYSGDATVHSGAVTFDGANGAITAIADVGKAIVTSDTIAATGTDTNGIQASGAGGAAVTTGNIDVAGFGVSASSSAGDTQVDVTGAVTSSALYGVRATGGDVVVNVGAGKSVAGATDGVFVSGRSLSTVTNAGSISGATGIRAGGTAVILNSGTIAGTSGAAISSSGATTLTNSGTLTAGSSGFAVVLGAADDSVTLKTGSVVNGVLDGGGGGDTLLLDGTGITSSTDQTVAQSVNFEGLDVAAGYWTGGTGASEYELVTIRSGATLQVDARSEGAPIVADTVINDGLLVLNAVGASTIDSGSISGTGGVTLIGNGSLTLSAPELTYTGATTVTGGTLILTANLPGDVVTTTGGTFRLGDGGTTGTFEGDLINDGSFIYDRSDSYTIAGNFSGTGALTKLGEGVLTFGGEYSFTGTTTINGGSVKFTGQLAPTTEINLTSGTLDLSGVEGGEQTIGELAGTPQANVELGESNLTIDQETNTTFAGSISGEGGIEKTGDGTLNLTGDNDYSGDTVVSGGTLKVNGSIENSTVVMSPDGTLGGNGTVGGVTGDGGRLTPGNSIGQLTVNGDILLNPAFTYVVEVNNAGAADRIDATGNAQLGGATLQVLAESGRYRGRTDYTILTAAGGVSGTFGTITSNYAFLTPSVSYGATTVTLSLTRNDAAFASFGQNANQIAVGTALQGLGAGNALYEETLLLQDTHVAPAFATLTGELHAGISSGRIENAQALRRSILGRATPEGAGLYGWANALGNWGDFGATNRSGAVKTDMTGALGGIGYSADGFDVALGLGATRSNFDAQGHADGTSHIAIGSLGYSSGGFWATLAGAYAWDKFDTQRAASLGAISQALTDKYEGKTSQVFGELGYGAHVGKALVGPFVGLSSVSIHSDAISEAGGSTGVNIAAHSRQLTYATAGLKAKVALALGESGWTVEPNLSAAYGRAWGDRADPVTAGFVGANASFGVLGPVLAKESAEVGIGIGATNGRFRLSAGYAGKYQKNGSSHSAQISLGFAF